MRRPLLLLADLDMEAVQHAMGDGCQHEARADHDDEAGEDGVEASKNFACGRVQLRHRAHAREDHRRVDERVRRAHALGPRVPGHADQKTAERQQKPQPEGTRHSQRELGAARYSVCLVLEAGAGERGRAFRSHSTGLSWRIMADTAAERIIPDGPRKHWAAPVQAR